MTTVSRNQRNKPTFTFAWKYGHDELHLPESEKQSYTLRRHIRFVLQIKASRMSPSPSRRRKGEFPQDICSSNRGQKRSNYCAKFSERTFSQRIWLTHTYYIIWNMIYKIWSTHTWYFLQKVKPRRVFWLDTSHNIAHFGKKLLNNHFIVEKNDK